MHHLIGASVYTGFSLWCNLYGHKKCCSVDHNSKDFCKSRYLFTEGIFKLLEIYPQLNMNEITSHINVKRKKKRETDNLEELSKEELIEFVKQLKASNEQLKNILNLKNSNQISKTYKKKPFNFSKVAKRHVLFKFLYLGWDYQGFVVQEDTNNTIENDLFNALMKCCLIENRETSCYHRCGRTDKGVSAFSQVISIDVRSRLQNPEETNCTDELPYCTMLNRVLPKNIRVYSWAHVGSGFSARFDCLSRSYKYIFPKGDLNIQVMQEGCKFLLGSHDFRNFCKMDVGNGVTNFIRNVTSVTVAELDAEMCEVTIVANAFLWHQIRCIVSVLILIGQGRESPDVIQKLLNVEEYPCKPQYNISSEVPLTLFQCDYDHSKVKWNVDQENLFEVVKSLQNEWTYNNIKTMIIKRMIAELEKLSDTKLEIPFGDFLVKGVKPKVYKQLLLRDTCETLDSRIAHYIKRSKLEVSCPENINKES